MKQYKFFTFPFRHQRLVLKTLTLLLLLISSNVFSQSANYAGWEFLSSYLTGGKVTLFPGESKSVQFNVTVQRFMTSDGQNWQGVNFPFQLFRQAQGVTLGESVPITSIYTITSSDFAANQPTVTKTYTLSLAGGPGASTDGTTLRNNDKIFMVVAGPWSPAKEYFVTVHPPPGNISGLSSILCGDTNPRTYSVTAVPGWQSYSWTLPSGWTGSSTTNSITVTPNGTNGGSISVKAIAAPYESSSSSLPISFSVTNPSTPPSSITSSSLLICDGSSRVFNLSNVPPGASVTWTASPSFLFDTSSGSGANATLDAANNISCCQGTITFAIHTGCGTLPLIHQNVQVGAPHVTFNIEEYPPGNNTYGIGSINSFQAQQASGMFNTYTGHQWGWRNLSNSTSAIEQGDVYYTFIPWDAGNYEIWVRATNECGVSELESVRTVCVGCWGMLAYPNPADNYLDLELEDGKAETESYQITLVDDTGTEKLKLSSKEKKKRINTAPLKKGQYILRVQHKEKVTERRIIIDR
jgi:hypothetical protein